MATESFPQWEGPQNHQQSFDFDDHGELSYDTPRIIPRALCALPGDGQGVRYENYDLRVGDDGLYYNEAGDAFEKEEGARVETFKLKETGEFLGLKKSIQAANPSFRPEYIDELARMRMRDRRRAGHAEEAKRRDEKKK